MEPTFAESDIWCVRWWGQSSDLFYDAWKDTAAKTGMIGSRGISPILVSKRNLLINVWSTEKRSSSQEEKLGNPSGGNSRLTWKLRTPMPHPKYDIFSGA